MAAHLPSLPTGFSDLTVDGKVDFVSSLWESILAEGEPASPEWHRPLVRAAVAEHESSPEDALSWDEVRASVEERLRKLER